MANHLWQSTLFAAAAAGLALALRPNRARVRHAVWLAASLKFLIPLSVLIALGGRIAQRGAPAPALSGWSVAVAVDEVSQPFTPLSAAAPPAPAPPARSSLAALGLGVWACGFLGIACAWWVRWRRIREAARCGAPLCLPLPVPARSSTTLLEPGVFGIFRPVLLLPEGIFERLTPAQLEAVVAHELCHVRHRDNLAAAVHMFVETVFWFHPLVWWIGKRMVAERELACDEEVLQLGSQPRDYAEGILNICKLYLESPVAWVSGVTGADLKQRIDAILNQRLGRRMSFARKAALAFAGLAAVAAPVVVGMIHAPFLRAQSAPAPAQKFEVASVKLARDCGQPMVVGEGKKGTMFKKGGIRALSPGRLHVCTTLQQIINPAYLRYAEDSAHPARAVEGGPGWLDSELYDINAKAEGPADQATMQGPMMRALLADRFQLKIHRETREIAVYNLTVARGGPKLQPTEPGSCTPTEPGKPMPEPVEGQKPFCNMSEIMGKATFAEWRLTGVRLSRLSGTLGGMMLDRPVVDQTGLTGMYDIHLEFGYEGLKLQHPPLHDDEPSGAPSIFSAIEKLGLKLEPGKGSADFLVIDHVQKPTQN